MSDVSRPPINPYAAPESKITSGDFSQGRWVTGYASFWRRLAASVIDSILVTVALFICMVGLFALASAVVPRQDQTTVMLIVSVGYLFAIVASVAYFVMMECSEAQATLGKSAMGIKVTDEHGRRISFGRSLGRYFGKTISSIFMIGFLMPLFTEKKQALHDMMAGTLVVTVR